MRDIDNILQELSMKPEIMDMPGSPMKVAMATVTDSARVFNEDYLHAYEKDVPGYEGVYKYVPFGADNELPFHIMHTIAQDEILSQNMFFNVLTAYGNGLRYADKTTSQPADGEIGRFFMRNSLKKFFVEQATDMKYYFFAVAVIILNKAGDQIVQIRHKDACYCRFEKANKHGRIDHVFYADWRKADGRLTRKDVEVLQLLDENDPLGHLEVLMGRAPGVDGETRLRTTNRKFAIVHSFPTPGMQYYPTPYYTAIFRGDWFDLKRLIGKGKKAKIRNHAGIRYQVEIDRRYWEGIVAEENIIDPEAIKKRIKQEKEKIKDFVTSIDNSGKMWITGFYTNPDGHEEHMVRINLVDTSKEGGDWSDDIAEAANMMCYATNIHPNLVGATPGKSQTNNSGSDKRELFTLKQSLETAFRDMLSTVHNVTIYFNGWENQVKVDVPIILLTTLDKKTDAIKMVDGEVSKVNS